MGVCVMENYKVRCQDCIKLTIKNGEWHCEECFGNRCYEIDDCPEGITAEEIETIAEQTKGRIDTGATGGKHREKKTVREKKVNELKQQIISEIFSNLQTFVTNIDDSATISIVNDQKYIDFVVNDRKFTINLVEHRKK